MLFVSCLSLFLAILSPPFIWTLSAFGHLIVCLFFDFEGQVPFGGLVTNILVNFVGLGTLGPMVLAFVGFIVSPVVAIIGKLSSNYSQYTFCQLIFDTIAPTDYFHL